MMKCNIVAVKQITMEKALKFSNKREYDLYWNNKIIKKLLKKKERETVLYCTHKRNMSNIFT